MESCGGGPVPRVPGIGVGVLLPGPPRRPPRPPGPPGGQGQGGRGGAGEGGGGGRGAGPVPGAVAIAVACRSGGDGPELCTCYTCHVYNWTIGENRCFLFAVDFGLWRNSGAVW